jgi:hypothetical protein
MPPNSPRCFFGFGLRLLSWMLCLLLHRTFTGEWLCHVACWLRVWCYFVLPIFPPSMAVLLAVRCSDLTHHHVCVTPFLIDSFKWSVLLLISSPPGLHRIPAWCLASLWSEMLSFRAVRIAIFQSWILKSNRFPCEKFYLATRSLLRPLQFALVRVHCFPLLSTDQSEAGLGPISSS